MSHDLKSLPDPPLDLKPEGKRIYQEVGEYLIKHNLFAHVDVTLLLSLAIWWEMYVDFYEKTKIEGTVQTFPNGSRQVSPEYTGMNAAMTKLNVLFTKLGIGEQARQKIKLTTVIGEDDPMQNF